MKITLRPFLLADAKPLARIIAQNPSSVEFQAQNDEFQVRRIKQQLQEVGDDPHQQVLVAVIPSGRVVGFVVSAVLPMLYLPGPELQIRLLFVAEDHPKLQIEEQLLAGALAFGGNQLASQVRYFSESKGPGEPQQRAALSYHKGPACWLREL